MIDDKFLSVLRDFLRFVGDFRSLRQEFSEAEFGDFRKTNEFKFLILTVRHKFKLESLDLHFFIKMAATYFSQIELNEVDPLIRKFLLNGLNFKCFYDNQRIVEFFNGYVQYCLESKIEELAFNFKEEALVRNIQKKIYENRSIQAQEEEEDYEADLADEELSNDKSINEEPSDEKFSDEELSNVELSNEEPSDEESSEEEPSNVELSNEEPSDEEPSEEEPSEEESLAASIQPSLAEQLSDSKSLETPELETQEEIENKEEEQSSIEKSSEIIEAEETDDFEDGLIYYIDESDSEEPPYFFFDSSSESEEATIYDTTIASMPESIS